MGVLDGGIRIGAMRWVVCIVALAACLLWVFGRANLMKQAHNDAVVLLGKQLFHSTLLSADHTISCASCHVPQLGFSGPTPKAIGVAGFRSARRAPSLLDLKSVQPLMWDGRYSVLAEQIHAPLESPEMAISWDKELSELNADPEIRRLSAAAVGLKVLTSDNVVKALAAYVESLQSGLSPFDRYQGHKDPFALTDQAQWGFRLFTRKANCASCHLVSGDRPDFTDHNFHAIGIGDGVADPGRFAVTKDRKDIGSFKTPSLRNVALRPFLMHDGSMTDLADVVRYYNKGGMIGNTNQDPRIQPLFLNDSEVAAIVAFLRMLTSDETSRSAWYVDNSHD
jgi:cytochrome c peroxidase